MSMNLKSHNTERKKTNCRGNTNWEKFRLGPDCMEWESRESWPLKSFTYHSLVPVEQLPTFSTGAIISGSEKCMHAPDYRIWKGSGMSFAFRRVIMLGIVTCSLMQQGRRYHSRDTWEPPNQVKHVFFKYHSRPKKHVRIHCMDSVFT